MLLNNHTTKDIAIPGTVKLVFVFSSGERHAVDPKLFMDLSEIFGWMKRRRGEFQEELNRLSSLTRPGMISVLEIYSNGEKRTILNTA